MGFWAIFIAPLIAPAIKAVGVAIGKAAGAMFGLGCLVVGSKSLHDMTRNQAEAKATEHWNKNSCNLNFSTASGGSEFYDYSYDAKGDHLDCKHLPGREAIEKEVKSYVEKCRDHDIASGCLEKTMGKAYWQIRISNDTELHPIANIRC